MQFFCYKICQKLFGSKNVFWVVLPTFIFPRTTNLQNVYQFSSVVFSRKKIPNQCQSKVGMLCKVLKGWSVEYNTEVHKTGLSLSRAMQFKANFKFKWNGPTKITLLSVWSRPRTHPRNLHFSWYTPETFPLEVTFLQFFSWLLFFLF